MGQYGLRIRDIKDARERRKASIRWRRAIKLAKAKERRERRDLEVAR